MVSDFSALAPSDIPIICLMGPTATGKTDAAAQLSDAIRSEIISVDSSLVYRHMDIGTAKPSVEFLTRYPHHLVNVREPCETYSVADFYNDSNAIIKQITSKGKVPILAGGTMFYFNALEHGLSDLPKADPNLRSAILQEAEKTGWPRQHHRLSELDPENASRIDSMDAQRIQRALEIVLTTGKTVSELNSHRKPGVQNPLLKVALAFSERGVLHDRIEQRFDVMLERGLKQEVQGLLDNGIDPKIAPMRMIGYRQMLEFLDHKVSFEEMRLKGIAATRQLAKRQLTWLRNQSNILWWMNQGLVDANFELLIRQLKTQLSYHT